jgi:hypothetical protein
MGREQELGSNSRGRSIIRTLNPNIRNYSKFQASEMVMRQCTPTKLEWILSTNDCPHNIIVMAFRTFCIANNQILLPWLSCMVSPLHTPLRPLYRVYDRYGAAMATAKTIGATSLTKLGELRPEAAFGVEVGFDPPVVVAAPLRAAVGEGPFPEPAVVDTLEIKLVSEHYDGKDCPNIPWRACGSYRIGSCCSCRCATRFGSGGRTFRRGA